MNKLPQINERFLKIAQLGIQPLADTTATATDLISIIHFIMQRVPQAQQQKFLNKLRQKIWNLNELQIASKTMTPGSAIGQSITFVKNVLNGYPPNYVRAVLKQISTKL